MFHVKHTFKNVCVFLALLKIHGSNGECARESRSVKMVCIPDPELSLDDGTSCDVTGYGKEREGTAVCVMRVISVPTSKELYNTSVWCVVQGRGITLAISERQRWMCCHMVCAPVKHTMAT